MKNNIHKNKRKKSIKSIIYHKIRYHRSTFFLVPICIIAVIFLFAAFFVMPSISNSKENNFSKNAATKGANLQNNVSTETTTDVPTEATTEAQTEPPTEPLTEPPTETPTKSPTEPPIETPPQAPDNVPGSYDHSNEVPLSAAVDRSYFDDAVFIGDSRTEAFILNTGLSNTTSYTHRGLMVDTVFTSPVINQNGSMVSVMDALKNTSFQKVYIMFGINETGWPYNHIFIEKYARIIDEIRRINPNAIIYVQSILPVSSKVSSTHSYIKNSKINEFNALIRNMAQEKQIYFIDTALSVAGADGNLPDDAATDGIHLKKAYCEKWLEYLQTHTIH